MYRSNNASSRVKHIHKFSSLKMEAVYTVKSALDFDTCFHLEYSPDVTSYVPYPEEFQYVFRDQQYVYIPTFIVLNNTNDSHYVEVSNTSKVKQSVFKDKFELIKSEVSRGGSSLILVTERQIRAQPILANLKLIHRYCDATLSENLQGRILGMVATVKVMPVSELIYRTEEPEGLVCATVLSLVASQKLSTNLDVVEFGISSLVWRPL